MLPWRRSSALGFGVLFGAPTLRLRGDYLAIVTLEPGEIVRSCCATLLASPTVHRAAWSAHAVDLRLHLSASISRPFYYLILALVRLVVFVSYRLQYSRTGRAWLALREDELAARSGWASTTHATSCWRSRSALGVGAWLRTFHVGKLTTATPDMFQFTVSTIILVMVVLGGMGSIPGVGRRRADLSPSSRVSCSAVSSQCGPNLGNSIGVAWLQTMDITQANQLHLWRGAVLMMLYRRQADPRARGVSALSPLASSRLRQLAAASEPTSPSPKVPDLTIKPGQPLLEVRGPAQELRWRARRRSDRSDGEHGARSSA